MKIRFYHWWVYKLFSYFWTPILKQNRAMLEGFHKYMGDYLENNK